MWKHKVLEHPDEEVTFTMKVIKKHHSSFQRMVMEAIVIGETQQQGHNILNSKSGFNRCLIPRLTIVVGDRVQPDPTDQAPYTDTEVAALFENNKRRRRKQPRDTGNNNIINNNIPPPPQKRRKVNARRNISNIHQGVDAIEQRNDKDIAGSEKNDTPKIDEQKQKSFPRSSLNSALAPPKLFSIFTQKPLGAKPKNRKPRTGKVKIHPLGNNQKITKHFMPVTLELDNSKRPNEPEVKRDQKIGDKVQFRFVG